MSALTRRRIFEFHAQLQAQAFEAAQSTNYLEAAEIEDCKRDFIKLAQQSSASIDHSRWLSRIVESDICLFGDFHTSAHSQEGFKSLLQSICRMFPTRSMVVCLETFLNSHQESLDGYASGKISEKQLIKRVNYATNWGFRWENYKSIVDFCVLHGIKLRGINTRRSKLNFSQRDALIAENIVNVHLKQPDDLILVLIGEYHLVESCLPSNIERTISHLSRKIKLTSVLNNVDQHFFTHLKQHQQAGGPKYLEIAESKLGYINTAPWLKWRSFTFWDDRQIDYQETKYESDSPALAHSALEDLFFDMVNSFADFIGMGAHRSHFQEFSLVLQKTGSRRSWSMRHLKGARWSIVLQQLERDGFVVMEDRSIVIEDGKELELLPRMVGEFLHLVHRPYKQAKAVAAEQFAVNVLQAAAGTFAAIVMNPHESPSVPGSAYQHGVKFDAAGFIRAWSEWLILFKSNDHTCLPHDLLLMIAEDAKSAKLYSNYLGNQLGHLIYRSLENGGNSLDQCNSQLYLSASQSASAWNQLLSLYRCI